MNEYDRFEADLKGMPLDLIEWLWLKNHPRDPDSMPAIDADEDYNKDYYYEDYYEDTN